MGDMFRRRAQESDSREREEEGRIGVEQAFIIHSQITSGCVAVCLCIFFFNFIESKWVCMLRSNQSVTILILS